MIFRRPRSWLLADVDGTGLLEIQRHDDFAARWGQPLPDDAAAMSRVRALARRGRRYAIEALAYHQRDKRALRRPR